MNEFNRVFWGHCYKQYADQFDILQSLLGNLHMQSLYNEDTKDTTRSRLSYLAR
jgi:hypothetical protein